MLGCIQPMSSPMMKRMLGFACCCCAAAGVLATVTATNDANRASQMPLALTIIYLLAVFSARDGSRQPAPKLRSQRPLPMWKQSQPCDTPRNELSNCSIFFAGQDLRMDQRSMAGPVGADMVGNSARWSNSHVLL